MNRILSVKTLPYWIIIMTALYFMRPFAHSFFPQTVDGEYYAARVASFYLSMTEGSIPPRLAPTYYSGLSYPVLNFNYPLPNILASLLHALGFSIANSLKLLAVGSYCLGGIGVYRLLQISFKSRLPSLVGSLLYLTAPYQLFDIFHRFSIGEIMMFGLLPWVIVTPKKVGQGKITKRLGALIYTAFLLVHNIMTALWLPLIAVYTHFSLTKSEKKTNRWPILTAILISMFFWLPALGEMRYTILNSAAINNHYFRELASIGQVVKLPGTYHPTLPPTSNTNQPGYAQLAVVLGAAFLLIANQNHRRKSAIVGWVVVAMSLASLFMLTKASAFIWQSIPPLKFIQHPTRLLFFWVCLTSFLGAWTVASKIGRGKKIIWVSGLIILVVANYRQVSYFADTYIPFDDAFLYQYPLTSAAGNEFDPIWYNRYKVETFLGQQNQEIISASPITVTNFQTSHFKKSYTVEASQSATLIERTLYFPGWQTRINGALIDTQKTAYNYDGLINYSISPGRHQVETRWTQLTPHRLVGNCLSVVGLLLLITNKQEKRNEKQPA